MGSGCNNNKRQSFGSTVVDGKVIYMGPAIPSLGICTGDTLSEVEAVILEQLSLFANGRDITVADLDLSQCEVMDEFVACCANNNSLTGVLDVIVKTICKVQSNMELMAAGLKDTGGLMIDPKCLVISDNTKLNSIMQAIIDSHCDLKEAFEYVFTDINNPSLNPTFVNQISNQVVTKVMTQITSCNGGITKSGVGAAMTAQFTAMVPVSGWVFYDGSLANFDSTGLGLATAGMCGWAICNGNNGTIDARGYTLAGATNVQGPTLDSRVDPNVNFDADYGANVGDKKGEVKHTLTEGELPPVNPPATSHVHNTVFNTWKLSAVGSVDGSIMVLAADAGGPGAQPQKTIATTAATNPPFSMGQGLKHETRQPTIYGVWIKRIN